MKRATRGGRTPFPRSASLVSHPPSAIVEAVPRVEPSQAQPSPSLGAKPQLQRPELASHDDQAGPSQHRPPRQTSWIATRLWALVPQEQPVAMVRLAFYLGGLACFAGVEILAPYTRAGASRPPGIVGVVVLLILGLAFFYLACRSTVPRLLGGLLPHGRWLAALGLVGALWLAVYGLGEIAQFPRILTKPHHYQNDAVTNTYCATQLTLHGHNPYTDFSMVECLASNSLGGRFTTPLQAGAFAHVRLYPARRELERLFAQALRRHVQRPAEFEAYISYPAGAFVVPLPFVALGWHEMSSFYLLWLVLAYLLVGWWAPRRLRLWLVPVALGNIALWGYVISGSSDAVDVFLILAGWASWRRPWLSGLVMGAAVATRQQAWFVVVFYALLVGRSYGWRALGRRLAVMGAVFAAINLPFVVAAPGAWINGALGPLKDPMFPLGAGLVALAVHGWLPLWPRLAYTGLEVGALAVSALVYARTCRRHPGTGLVLALVPLVFAWRSLFTYFLPLPLFCLWPLLTDLRSGVVVHQEGGRDVAGNRDPDPRYKDKDLLGTHES